MVVNNNRNEGVSNDYRCNKRAVKNLKLRVASDELEEVLGKKKNTLDISWLQELLEREMDARRDHAIERRIKKQSSQSELQLNNLIGILIKNPTRRNRDTL